MSDPRLLKPISRRGLLLGGAALGGAALLAACGQGAAPPPTAPKAAEAPTAAAKPTGTTAPAPAATAAPTAASSAPAKLTPVRIGYFANTCEAPLYSAYENGFWKKEGLDVELVAGDSNTLKDALATGKIDATDGLLMQWIKAVEQGLDVKFTTGIHTGCIQVVVPNNSPIKTIADIKGKNIGVPTIGGGPMNLLSRLLASNGIDPKTGVTWKAFPQAELELALNKGEVDLLCLADPLAQMTIDKGGAHSAMNSATDAPFKDEYCCLVVTRGKLVRENPETATAIARGWMQGAKWVSEHPVEAAKILVDKKYVAGDPNVNSKLLATYNYKPSVAGGRDAVLAAAKQSKAAGILEANTDTDALAKAIWVDLKDLKEIS